MVVIVENALDTLYLGVAVDVVAFALAASHYISEKEKMDDLEIHPEEEKTRAQNL